MAEWTLDTGQADTGQTLTATEAARICHVHHRTIRRAIARGDLAATKHAGVFHIELNDLAAWRTGCKRGSPGQPRGSHRSLEFHSPQHQFQPMTSFIGRESALAEVVNLLAKTDIRLLVLTGPGGVGKTRLARECLSAPVLREKFNGRTWFADLSAIDDPSQIISYLLRSVAGRSPERTGTPADELRASFGNEPVLLVIDNFEHVLDGAPDIGALLTDTPGLTLLVTSRERLRLSVEQVYQVRPMTLPVQTGDATMVSIRESEAVRLFVERARRVAQDFAITEQNADAVAEVCRRLDGLPLAIELAAARINLLSPVAMVTRLDDRFSLLREGPRDMPERLRTMHAAIGWSYGILTEEEQSLFRRIAVFSDGCSLEAIAAISDTSEIDHFSLIGGLVAKSLVLADDRQENVPRFRLLETIKEFARLELASHDELDSTAARHAGYFLDLAHRLSAELEARGPFVQQTVTALAVEQPNFWTALEWFESKGDEESLRRLALALQDYWTLSGDWDEGVHWLTRAAGANRSLSPERARTLGKMGMMLITMGKRQDAEPVLAEALEIARPSSDLITCEVLGYVAWLRALQTRFSEAAESASEMQSLALRSNSPKFHASGLHWAGVAAMGQHRKSLARQYFEREELVRSECSWPPTIVSRHLGMYMAEDGDFARSADWMRQILENEPLTSRALAILLDDFACLAAMLHKPERAARLFGACGHLTDAIHMDKFWVDPDRVGACIERARQELGDESYQREFERGTALSRHEIDNELEAVLTTALRAGNGRSNDQPMSGLTRRELEVLTLLIQRYSNSEIAALLNIGTRTVQTHTTHIYQKLNVNSRREAADAANRLGLR